MTFLLTLLINILIFQGAGVCFLSHTGTSCESNRPASSQDQLCRHLGVRSLYSAKSFIIPLSDFPPSIMWFGVTDVS